MRGGKGVLTANIGTLLDLYGVERGLDHFRSTPALTFDQFQFYLQKEVFAALPEALGLAELRHYEAKIAEVCWLVCRSRFVGRMGRVLCDVCVYRVFRVFCVLAELQPAGRAPRQAALHPAEAGAVAQRIAGCLGAPWDEEDFASLGASIGGFRLGPFISLLETRALAGVKDAAAICEAVLDVYQTVVEDVIKKGYLSKRGYILPTMKDYWFVLRPSELSYFRNRSEKNLCGAVPIAVQSRIEPKTDNKFVLHTPERTIELATTDHMTRLQWIAALRLAIDHCGGSQSYQRLLSQQRRMQRQSRMQEVVRVRSLLQQERSARQAAEGQAKELEAAFKEEAKKLTELEVIRDKLEKLLEEETQAKRDEEIVRALQARVLAEEWEKREELERLQAEQNLLLKAERDKRKEFEELQNEKEIELDNAQKMLEQLEKERQDLDQQLKAAHDRILLSEEKRDILERRLMQVAPNLRNGDRVRRAHSFVPSTKERPVVLDVKSSTLTRRYK